MSALAREGGTREGGVRSDIGFSHSRLIMRAGSLLVDGSFVIQLDLAYDTRLLL